MRYERVMNEAVAKGIGQLFFQRGFRVPKSEQSNWKILLDARNPRRFSIVVQADPHTAEMAQRYARHLHLLPGYIYHHVTPEQLRKVQTPSMNHEIDRDLKPGTNYHLQIDFAHAKPEKRLQRFFALLRAEMPGLEHLIEIFET